MRETKRSTDDLIELSCGAYNFEAFSYLIEKGKVEILRIYAGTYIPRRFFKVTVMRCLIENYQADGDYIDHVTLAMAD